jgi:hypothetical protein
MRDIARFLDDNGRVTTWPAKRDMKAGVLEYVAGKFEYERSYTEKEVNAVVSAWHTFDDHCFLRRGLIDYKLLKRTTNGSKYWREKDQDISMQDPFE